MESQTGALQDSTTGTPSLPPLGERGRRPRLATAVRPRAVAALSRQGAETDSLATVRHRERISRRTLVAADAAAAAVGGLLVFATHTGYALQPGYLLILPLIVVVAKLQGLYDHDELVIRKSTLDELPRLVNLITLMTLLVWLSRHITVVGAPGTGTLLELWVVLLALTVIGRMIARGGAARFAPRERCFFVGDLTTAQRVRSKLENSASVELVGVAGADEVALGREALDTLARQYDIHRVIIASSAGVAEQHTIDLVRAAKAAGLRVTICPGMLGVVGSSLVLDDVWGMPLLGVPRFGLSRSSALVKRAFDLFGAGIGLVLVAPLLALTALLIRLESAGPVLFRQLRIGRDGEPFEIFKFRTMVPNAEALKASLRADNEAEGIFKVRADPRITRVGAVLRKTSLDELPQLVNVLRGKMSLVGPRPLVIDEDELITGLDRHRLVITPGMTGVWQILGSARLPLHEMIKLDYMYVANWSLWSDIKILLRTVGVVVARQGI